MKILIRHAEPDDYKAIHSIYTQPKVVRGTLQLPYISAEKRQQELAEPRAGTYTLVACVENEVVGHLNLHTSPNSPRRKHVGSLGMGVHDEWQGKGIGTALMAALIDFADKWLNLIRLELSVYVDNEPAVRLYKKFGFDTEGKMQDYAFQDGQYAAVYMMARVRKSR